MQQREFSWQLWKFYGVLTVGFGLVVLFIAWLESIGLSKDWIGYTFTFATIALYAGIGLMSRTSDIAEYYVASRQVPAVFNGLAIGADWMSAASFIGMAGTLYFSGYDGLAYIMGWTGGYVLVALLVAPYLRRFGQFTVPDFLASRFAGHNGGRPVRLMAVLSTLISCFIYVVAQIYGVGLITSRFTGVEFGIGVFLGLAGILVCSFLGGMKAITWTQVAQYIIMIVAFLGPVSILSMERTGNPIPMFAYGQLLQDIGFAERAIAQDPREQEVRKVFKANADVLSIQIETLPSSWAEGLEGLRQHLDDLRRQGSPFSEIKAAERALHEYPESPDEARQEWSAQRIIATERAQPPTPHTQPFAADTPQASRIKKINFIALALTLMLGTAALPHILTRFYTTRNVRAARWSVFWGLSFIVLLYVTAPALAVLVKDVVYTQLVGIPFPSLPAWVAAWHKVDPALMTVTDINGDGVVQLAEIAIGADIITLATPEIAGLPYVISGLVAAGGLAAALSTADGLLLTIASALSHDVYYKVLDNRATTQKRVTISKIVLLIVALTAAWVTSLRPGNILYLVGAAFSLAASGLFPALIVGVLWSKATQRAALWGMAAGLFVSVAYMVASSVVFARWFDITPFKLWGIDSISSAVFGVPVGIVVIVLVSWLKPSQSEAERAFIRMIRSPESAAEAAAE